LLLRKQAQFHQKLRALERGEIKLGRLDEEGNSLLHLAFLNRPEKAITLIKKGLSLDLPNRLKLTPHDLSLFLKPSSSENQAPITIFRNSDQQKHQIPIVEFEKKLKMEYLEHLEFDHPDFLRWSIWKGQKLLKKKKVRQMNRWNLALHEKAILKPRYDHIYIRHISSSIGYGVFASRDLGALTYIGEYTGLVTRRQTKKTRFNDYVFGYMTGPKESPFIIDAYKKGNFTRFINHSDEPNLNSRWVICKGVTRIILFANRLIKKDEQLTYDYGKYYWRRRSAPKNL